MSKLEGGPTRYRRRESHDTFCLLFFSLPFSSLKSDSLRCGSYLPVIVQM
jgi:hypothetical protein